MNERTARDVMAVRALETTDRARELWSDSDREQAGDAAAAVVGESASDDAYLGQRAASALERIGRRHPRFVALTRASSSRRWVAPALAIVAFAIGAAGADVGPGQRINLLAPPVLALLAWNIAVYAVLIGGALRAHRSPAADGGPLRRLLGVGFPFPRKAVRRSGLPLPLSGVVVRFANDWTSAAAPIWRYRAARVLHTAAAAMAAGVIAGLYVRGIALEYRAGWQSTFLDARDVARLLHVVLAPGAWLTGLGIPDAPHLRDIGGEGAGENAARWIHLFAATIVIAVVVPRLLLAATAWTRERRVVARFPLPRGDPYFERLVRGWRRGTAQVAAVAYSYHVPATSAQGAGALLRRALQSGAHVQWLDVVPYGADDPPALPARPLAAVVAVFNLVATPEPETHRAFLEALEKQRMPGVPLVAIVDTSEFLQRAGASSARVDARREAWRRVLDMPGAALVFARLADLDVNADGDALADALERPAP